MRANSSPRPSTRTSRPSGSHGSTSSAMRPTVSAGRDDLPSRPMVHPRYAEVGAFGRRVLGAVQRRTGTTPPARDRTGFYAPVDPGPGPARRGARDRAARRSAAPPPATASATARSMRPAGRSPPRWRSPCRRPPPPGPGPSSCGCTAPAAWPPGAGRRAAGSTPGTRPSSAPPARSSPRRTSIGLGMEGPVHPYLHGTTAGPGVLDAARAAAELAGARDRRRVGRPLRRRLRRAVGERAGGGTGRRRPRRPAGRADVARSRTSR